MKLKWKIVIGLVIGIIYFLIYVILLAVLSSNSLAVWGYGFFLPNGIVAIILMTIFFIRFIKQRTGKSLIKDKLTKETRYTKDEAKQRFRDELMEPKFGSGVQPTNIIGRLTYEGKNVKQPIYEMKTRDKWNKEQHWGIFNLHTGDISLENLETLYEKEKVADKLKEVVSRISEDPVAKLPKRVIKIDEFGNKIEETEIPDTVITQENKEQEEESKEIIGGGK